MQKVQKKVIRVPAEDGRLFVLAYFVLVDDSQTPARYGVEVVEQISGETASSPALTTDASRVLALAKTLANCAVTPTTLADVVADHFFEEAAHYES